MQTNVYEWCIQYGIKICCKFFFEYPPPAFNCLLKCYFNRCNFSKIVQPLSIYRYPPVIIEISFLPESFSQYLFIISFNEHNDLMLIRRVFTPCYICSYALVCCYSVSIALYCPTVLLQCYKYSLCIYVYVIELLPVS